MKLKIRTQELEHINHEILKEIEIKRKKKYMEMYFK